jgi:hypothetical protein
MAQHNDTLILLKATDLPDEDFLCPTCNAFVARLKGVEVADLTDPESYAVAGLIEHKGGDFLGVPLAHRGRLGNGYCRRKFFFWDVNQGLVRVTPTVRIVRAYAAT